MYNGPTLMSWMVIKTRTYDKNLFSKLPAIVENLHNNSQHYMAIVDSAISSEQPVGTYPPFDDGKDMDVFVKRENGDILIGWPGLTAYPDFFHPNATAYLYKQASAFYKTIPFDGLWIDKNEPSNFVDGSTSGCPDSAFNNPPYVPPSLGSLFTSTICPSVKQYLSEHYNLHNMYGWSNANVTRKVLNAMFPYKRTQLITRSSFPGTGVNAGHALTDNAASFEDLYYSIPGILNFNMFGISQVGADICGYRNPTTEELCTRWMQLGVFYPFMRNHNSDIIRRQDPLAFMYMFSDRMQAILRLRYQLLSVLYNLFYEAHTAGLPIVRPLLFMYPGTETIDKQFMWGNQLLISPVLKYGERTVNAFVPNDVWYNFYDGSKLDKVGQNVLFDSSIDNINVHIRGGSILTLLPPPRSHIVRKANNFVIVIAPDGKGTATGRLFWDDGESMDSITAGNYSLISFSLVKRTRFEVVPLKMGYNPPEGIKMQTIIALDVSPRPTNVTINGKPANHRYEKDGKKLTIDHIDQDLLTKVDIFWS